MGPKQSVDGSSPALEIVGRSSYVPAFTHRRPGLPGDAPNVVRLTRVEMPLWMKS
jgi:hypothetical protein